MKIFARVHSHFLPSVKKYLGLIFEGVLVFTGLAILVACGAGGAGGGGSSGNSGTATLSLLAVTPSAAASGVNINTSIAATFSAAIDPATANTANFAISGVTGTVTTNGATVTFTPSAPLLSNTAYTALITTGIKSTMGVALNSASFWSFTTAYQDITPPTVQSTSPANGGAGIGTGTTINALFSEAMDPSTITTSTFILLNGATQISGAVIYNGTTATFFPNAPLLPNSTYTARITAGAKDLAGNALGANYSWSFATVTQDVTPPTILSTTPTDSATNVSENIVVTVTFSEAMDPSTINATNFILRRGSSLVPGTVNYSGTTASFTSTSTLSSYTTYTATITTGTKDVAGNPISSDHSWTFRTADYIPPSVLNVNPINAASGVPVNTTLSATFSEAMDPSTITTVNFSLTNGSAVPGTVSYDAPSTTATFIPGSPLASNSAYTATITTGIKDLAGNAMSANTYWQFTTSAQSQGTPAVVFTYPFNGASGVDAATSIFASFSEAMDPSSISASIFTLANGATNIPGTVIYTNSPPFYFATFTPSTALNLNTLYTATITTGAVSLSGHALSSDYSWSFTTIGPDITPPTVTSTGPINSGSGIDLNTSIFATFSEAINPSTINATNFILMDGSTPITGTVNFNGTYAIFTSANFLPNKTYTATLTTGVQDLAGNSLASNYSWNFTTKDVLFRPYVSTSVGSFPEAVAIGDVNGDGRNDVVLTTSFASDPSNDAKVFVFLQNPDGSLAAPIKYSPTSHCGVTSVAIGDVTGDGKNDVVITACGIEVFAQNTSGGLDSGVFYSSPDSSFVRIADLNNDGRLDVVSISAGTVSLVDKTKTLGVWLQNSNGTLNAPIIYHTLQVGSIYYSFTDLKVGDVNHDGLTDVVVLDNRTDIEVLTQTSNGSLNPPVNYHISTGYDVNAVAVGDMNGDGLSDIVATVQQENPAVAVFAQNSLGTLDPSVSHVFAYNSDNAGAITIADITGDGRKDIITLHKGSLRMGCYRQLADGTLSTEELYATPYASIYNPHGLAVGDINGDGKNDVVMANYNYGLVVLYHY